MKKYVLSLMVMVLMVGLSSCSKNDDENKNESSLSENITGKIWKLDSKNQTEYKFYKNHLVSSISNPSVASGALAGGDSNFFGTWQSNGNSLTTTFNSGSYEGFDWNSILYGTLTDFQLNASTYFMKESNGNEHEFIYNKTFIDYTDETIHDKALHGTWKCQAYVNDVLTNFSITISDDGNVRFVADNLIDFTTNYTTSNGHVTFDNYLAPNSGKHSFIYVRDTNNIKFYSEKTADILWTWNN